MKLQSALQGHFNGDSSNDFNHLTTSMLLPKMNIKKQSCRRLSCQTMLRGFSVAFWVLDISNGSMMLPVHLYFRTSHLIWLGAPKA